MNHANNNPSSRFQTVSDVSGLFGKFRISHRLYAGFALLILLLAGAVGVTLWQVGSIGTASERISNQRVPTALASEELTNALNASSAGVRGFLLTGSEKMRADFDAAWKELDEVSVTFDKLAAGFTNPENVKRWADFNPHLPGSEIPKTGNSRLQPPERAQQPLK